MMIGKISQLALKNVWRNPKRSLIVIVAVLLGTLAGVFTAALMKGMFKQRLHDAVYVEQSHIRVRNPLFLQNEDPSYVLPAPDSLIHFLSQQSEISAFSSRTIATAMLNTARGMASVMLIGVDPLEEVKTSELPAMIIAGTYLSKEKKLPLFISDHIAEQLGIKTFRFNESFWMKMDSLEMPEELITQLKPLDSQRFSTKRKMQQAVLNLVDVSTYERYKSALEEVSANYRLSSKVVLNLTGVDGELSTQLFRLAGVFQTNNLYLNTTHVYVKNSDLSPLLGLSPSDIHELRIVLDDDLCLDSIQQNLSRSFPEYSVMNWKQAAPEAGLYSSLMDLYTYLTMGFILFALIFGIINTMLMSVLERTKEFGMLLALGMSKRLIFLSIMLETLFLSSIGASLGMAIAFVLIEITGHTGIDFGNASKEIFSTEGFATLVYPELGVFSYFFIAFMVFVMALLAALYPAKKALSFRPVEALRSDD